MYFFYRFSLTEIKLKRISFVCGMLGYKKQTINKLYTTMSISVTARTIGKKKQEVGRVFCPSVEGISEWVSRETIDANPILNWGRNGTGRHGVYWGDNRYVWEKRGLSAITALRTVGFSDNHLYGASRPIRKDIHTHHKAIGCVVCGSHSDLVTDHKNDLYNDPRVLDAKTQTLDDFQCLCNHCNLQKRQVSKTTKETGVRFSAMRIPSLAIWGVGFVDGGETFDTDDVNAMVGTYWHDPVEFMKKLKTIVS